MDTIINTTELLQKIEALAARVEAQEELIAKLQALVKHYESQLLMLKRRQFGASSEKYAIDGPDYRQLGLFGDADAVILAPPEPETEDITYSRKKRKGKREDDLSGLPVERIDYEMPESGRVCPECGDTMRDIGVDVRRELKLIPAKVVVVEHAAHTYACRNCQETAESTPIVKAQTPAALIPGSLASPSFVAHIAYQKYSNATPLYRLEKGFIYDGVNISRQTMSNWVVNCSELYLTAVYSLLIKHLLKESVLHADETTLQVLREPGRDATSESYEWVYRTGACAQRKIVIYDYKQTRKQEHPKEFLKEFTGLLHTDGYQAYHNLPHDIVVVGCWAHVRRKWEHLLKTLPKDKRKDSDAERGVMYIGALFSLEREFKKLSPEERYKKRLEKSKPLAEAFLTWVENLGALPKSPLGVPAQYTLSQREFLMNVFLDGRLELSNNSCERAVKPFVIGRKNWLFSNTPSGAAASSVMYSIIETAKANDLHPFHYLKFLLETLPNITEGSLENSLPWSDTLPDSCRIPAKGNSGKSHTGSFSGGHSAQNRETEGESHG